MFDVNIISTGSKGNCVVIDGAIMCDAGLTKKKIMDSGYDLSRLEVLIISHKHQDHTNLPFLRWAIKTGVEVHIPQSVVSKLREEDKIDIDRYLHANVYTHDDLQPYDFDIHIDKNGDGEIDDDEKIHFTAHPQKHHDIVNYAFTFEKESGERLLYSTDLDTVEPTDIGPGLVDLGTFDTIILEGNFDETWLREYIVNTMAFVDPDVDTASLTDQELDKWVRRNYRQMPKDMSAGLFRAVQNMRHLSKQQARLYVHHHLREHGRYYEVHRSSMFYERPSEWSIDTLTGDDDD